MSKEQWLRINGEVLDYTPTTHKSNGKTVVSLMDNGSFRAAAIAYSQDELMAFQRSDDPRPKIWYLVPDEKLQEVMK